MTTPAPTPKIDSSAGSKQKRSGVFARRIKINLVTTASAAIMNTEPTFKSEKQSGTVLSNVKVQLIFWGTDWGKTAPLADQVVNHVRDLLNSSFMVALTQHGINAGSLLPEIKFDTVTKFRPDPPPRIIKADIENVIHTLVDKGIIGAPKDPQVFYCVMLPRGTSSLEGDFKGEHSFFDIDGDRVHYAWVENNGKLNFITTAFSHELIETVSDPDGDGVVIVPDICNQQSWCEIADVCVGVEGVVGDTAVQAYWSEQNRACVIPGGTILTNLDDLKEQL